MTARCLLIPVALFGAMLASVAAEANDSGSGNWGCGSGAFNGFYFGPNIGYANNDGVQSTQGLNIEANDASPAVGGQVGYGLQCGKFLIGIETDFNWVDLDATNAFPGPVHTHTSIDWFGTVRGRLGYVYDERVLLYATGGLAYANLDHQIFDSSVSFSRTDSDDATGWTVGGGVEWLRDHSLWGHRLSLNAEAFYVDLGNERHFYVVTTGCGSVCTNRTNWGDDFFVARLGLNFRFQPEPPAPLK